jgi:PilZ domain-containing protein
MTGMEGAAMTDLTHSRQRRHERVYTDIPVRISTIEPDRDPLTGRSYFRASQERCANVSRGGAFIRTTELLDPGRRVLVEISLPDGAQVEAIGRVAWKQHRFVENELGCGVGVEFLGGAAEQFSVLEEFVKRGSDERTDH